MTHFVLVHGGWHGAWCWTETIGALRTAGHQASAVQLPSDEVGAGAEAYADVIASAVAPSGSVVVGHSLAGLAIPLVPARANVSALIYLAALLPEPGRSWRDQLGASRPMADWCYTNALPVQGRDEQGRTFWEPGTARDLFFHDCAPDVASGAADLLRPQAPTPVAEVTPVRAFPSVPAHYVIAREDRAVSGEWAARTAVERLGVEPTLIDGSHSPFLARPVELARLLTRLAVSWEPQKEPSS
jgi:hypothetical protein